jgi:hypothetical protein
MRRLLWGPVVTAAVAVVTLRGGLSLDSVLRVCLHGSCALVGMRIVHGTTAMLCVRRQNAAAFLATALADAVTAGTVTLPPCAAASAATARLHFSAALKGAPAAALNAKNGGGPHR